MTTYPIFPTVDSDTKLFPQPTMDALAGALPFASDADVAEKLDSSEAEVLYAPKTFLLASDYGVSSSASAADNTSALQAAVDAAVAQGKDLQLPSLTPSSAININSFVTVTGAGGITIYGGGSQTTIHQTVKPLGIFVVNAPNVIIRDMNFTGDNLDMTGMGDPTVYMLYAGVRLAAGADGSSVFNVSGANLQRVVTIDPGTGLIIRNITVDGVTSNRCWTGLVAARLKDVSISNVRGTYLKSYASDSTDVGQPPHLIYIVDHSDATDGVSEGVFSYNVQVSDCMAWDSEVGKAYAIKGIIGGTGTNLLARGTHGLLDAINLTDFTFDGIYSVDDVYPTSPGVESDFGSVSFSGCLRAIINGGSVRFAFMDHGPGYYIIGSTDCKARSFEVIANRVTESVANAGYAGFVIKGYNNILENCVFTSIGANVWCGFQPVTTGTKMRLDNPATRGNIKYGIVIYGVHDNVVNYDPALLRVNERTVYGASITPTDLGTAAKGLAILGASLRPQIRPTDRDLPRGPEYFFWEYCLNIPLSGHGASRASSGQANALSVGSWSADLTSERMLQTQTASTGNNILTWSTARILGEAASPNFEYTDELIWSATNASSRVGNCFRAVDVNNFLAFGATLTGWELMKLDTSVETVLGSSTAVVPTVGRKYVLKYIVYGNQIDCYVDGVKLVSYTLTTGEQTKYGSTGSIGRYCKLSNASKWGDSYGKRLS